MFATSSGTTAKRKLDAGHVRNSCGRLSSRLEHVRAAKLLTDHPTRHLAGDSAGAAGVIDETFHTAAGIPYGAITGLLARTQKRNRAPLLRRTTRRLALHRRGARIKYYYVLMRFAADRDVAFAITANPATLIRLGETASDAQSEQLIRDIHDGTICADRAVRTMTAAIWPSGGAICGRLRNWRGRAGAATTRASGLPADRETYGMPSVPGVLDRAAAWATIASDCADWWGAVPVRDIGLLASEGRVSIPFDDGTPSGVIWMSRAAVVSSSFRIRTPGRRQSANPAGRKNLEIGAATTLSYSPTPPGSSAIASMTWYA